MQATMQDVPLSLTALLRRSAALFAGKRLHEHDESGLRTTRIGDLLADAARLRAGLERAGLGPGDVVTSLAWNTRGHLLAMLVVPAMGGVLHTANPRLTALDLRQQLALARPKLAFVDASVEALWHEASDGTVPTYMVSSEPGAVRGRPLGELLVASAMPVERWPDPDERSAAVLCFTSGTSGAPKGVVYSHRSIFLHALAQSAADDLAISERDTVLPVVPLYHGTGWGFPFSALLNGADLVLNGRASDPQTLAALIRTTRATVASAVPTVWLALLQALESGSVDGASLATLRVLPIGGAAVSARLVDGFARFGVEVVHCWGMTETSPVGTVGRLRTDLPQAERRAARLKQGLPRIGVELRIVDAAGNALVPDGTRAGELQARGPYIAGGYLSTLPAADLEQRFADDGGRRWLRTGDVATIDAFGYMKIVDRDKDLIKSGGEWISSQDMELALLDCPGVRDAAVVGTPDARWGERPVAFIAVDPLDPPDDARIAGCLTARFAKWQLPDRYVRTAQIARTATGKHDKKALRALLASGDES